MHKRFAMLALVVALSSCASSRFSPELDATQALIYHPQFHAAAKAAPLWVDAALKQITAYEKELARR